jgi:hypothetical protein
LMAGDGLKKHFSSQYVCHACHEAYGLGSWSVNLFKGRTWRLSDQLPRTPPTLPLAKARIEAPAPVAVHDQAAS